MVVASFVFWEDQVTIHISTPPPTSNLDRILAHRSVAPAFYSSVPINKFGLREARWK